MPNHSEPHTLFAALGDPTRVAVVMRLCRGSASVTQLAAPFDMALPSFLQHLRVLEDAGWIATHKEGRVRTCEIRPEALQITAAWLLAQRALWERRLDQLDDHLATLADLDKTHTTKKEPS